MLFLKLNKDVQDLDVTISMRRILQEKVKFPVKLIKELKSHKMKEDLLFDDVLIPAGIVLFIEKKFKVNKEEAMEFYLQNKQYDNESSEEEL